MRSTKSRCFRSCSWSLWKLLRRRGALAWFHGIWTCSTKVLEYWMISLLKIKLHGSWKFWRNRNVPLVFLKRSCWVGFNGIYLVRFGFRMWEILIFKWFLSLKIQINSKKPGFGRKNQLRMRTSSHTGHHTSVYEFVGFRGWNTWNLDDLGLRIEK
jgi:hypothetical protein